MGRHSGGDVMIFIPRATDDELHLMMPQDDKGSNEQRRGRNDDDDDDVICCESILNPLPTLETDPKLRGSTPAEVNEPTTSKVESEER